MKLSSYSNKCSLSRGVRPEDTFHCRKRHKTSTSIKRTPLNMEICMSPPFGVSNKEVSLKRTCWEWDICLQHTVVPINSR